MKNTQDAGIWILTKSKAVLDRPLVYLDSISSGLKVSTKITYRERCIVCDFSWILLDGCEVVYDIGANEGFYTSAFCKIDQIANVIAFEPLPDVFERLSRTFDDDSKVMTIHCALGESRGVLALNANKFTAASSLLEMADAHRQLFAGTGEVTPIPVQVYPLDDLVKERRLPNADLIKIDVQGFEDRVVKGAKNSLLAARYCVIEVTLVELYAYSSKFTDLNGLMESLGFEIAGMIGQLQPVASKPPVAVDVVYRNRAVVSQSNTSSHH